MVDRDLTAWTQGERLWLWRMCRGYTQAQAGRVLGCGRHKVSAMEAGLPGGRSLEARIQNFTPDLECQLALARRRAGLGLVGTAKALGVSAVTLLTWERRADPRLVNFWEARRFTFAPKRE